MKKTSTRTHYGDKDGLLVLSYGAIISAVLSNRNYGKTWAMQRRAFRRALKHGKKTLWLRMFKKEVKDDDEKKDGEAESADKADGDAGKE